MSDAKEEKKEEVAEKPKSKKKLFLIVGVVLGVVVLGGGAAMMLGGGKKEKTEESEPKEEVKHLATLEFPNVIVNLSDSSSFLKVTLLVEYDTALIAGAEGGAPAGGGGGGHSGGEGGGGGSMPAVFSKREPMIKDAIIRVLSSKKVEEMLTPEGKEKLKEELIEAINEALGLEEAPVVAIYFTDFIIQ